MFGAIETVAACCFSYLPQDLSPEQTRPLWTRTLSGLMPGISEGEEEQKRRGNVFEELLKA